MLSQRGHPRRRARQALDRKSLGPAWPTILAWLENDVPDEESLLLNTHVPGCDDCREKLALMKMVEQTGMERTDAQEIKSR